MGAISEDMPQAGRMPDVTAEGKDAHAPHYQIDANTLTDAL